ncbi:hypothetical protein EIN_339620 [Entamoeba invadens IP1]|uniref:Uncharacterized protein n=1 Tax=Entamoeba invadens IP1 TaxID=370355 RepID=A0A0A1U785_ENTIV|nr:hypothetical protein EIN_339620 [Entamoeba invadens IP1]ELP90261.1 hypothetical protein EIN_339620 [Entamoeba invadens IP1]|eukprot:XP_004257032.1 hypothetical protein EIN_339620 [Entamoeba invadens IP1]
MVYDIGTECVIMYCVLFLNKVVYNYKPSHKENLLNRNSMNRLLLLSFKTPSTLGTNSEIGPILKRRRVDEELATKDKEFEALKKKLAEEITKREAAEKVLSEMKIKNVDLEALV